MTLEVEDRDAPCAEHSEEEVIAAARNWLARAVIGLRLCPFAAAPFARGQIRYRVSEQRSTDRLLQELAQELRFLKSVDPLQCETSLLIHPYVLNDFGDYNQFLFTRAVAMYPDVDEIAERNIATLRALGEAGWRAVMDPRSVEN